MSRTIRDPHRALIAMIEDALGPVDDLQSVARPWASATFVGQRHVFDFSTEAAPDRVAHFVAALPELEIPLVRAFVADIAVAHGVGNRLSIEALTIDER